MKVAIETKLIRYLYRWPEGLSTTRMAAWIASCRKDDGYTNKEYESALYSLRDSGRVACVNKIWYLKDIPSADLPQQPKIPKVTNG